jgi:predicted RNA-binding protein with PUA-like domain
MAVYLLKTEPSVYAFADLVREERCVWEGVTNPGALLHLRAIRRGDEAFIYHTGDERAIVGLARVVRGAFADPARPGLNKAGEPRFPVIELAPLRSAKRPVTLSQIKADARFKEFALVRQGRLSVMRVPDEIDGMLRSMAGC